MNSMDIISWVVLGGLAGWIASMIFGNNKQQGIIGNIVVGIIGAFLGGFLFRFFGQSGVTGFNLYSFMVAVIGAVVTLFLKRAISGKRR